LEDIALTAPAAGLEWREKVRRKTCLTVCSAYRNAIALRGRPQAN